MFLSSLASELHYMGDGYASAYIIGRNQSIFWKFMIFLWGITKKKRKWLNYSIEYWHTSTPYDIFWNQSTYPNVCFLLYTWKCTNHCITVCGKWIFDSNFEVEFLLTQDCLNYTCRGNDTDDINFFNVLHSIKPVHTEVVQRRLNMK